MRAVVRWLRRYVVLLGILTLPSTGCAQEANNDTADATTTTFSPIETTGPVAFVAEARTMTFGNKDLAAASDGVLLRLGTVVCDGLGMEGVSLRRVIARLMQSEARPTTTEATAFVRSAVRKLCPAHASAVPV
jgi:hypothetical protein